MSKGPPSDRYHTLKLNNEEVDIIAESLEHHAADIEEFFRDDALLARRLARFIRKMKYKNNGGTQHGSRGRRGSDRIPDAPEGSTGSL